MAPMAKKRRGEDASRHQSGRDAKKAKKLSKAPEEREADAEASDDSQAFEAVDLLDSDDDLDNAEVDDGLSTDAGDESDGSLGSLERTPNPTIRRRRQPRADDDADDAPSGDESDAASSAGSGSGSGSDSNEGPGKGANRAKRNDPTMFATSMQKILGTKLSTSRRADPVLSRSAAAHEASRRIVDAALEEKARRQLRLEKRVAMEKGRVKDVLIASNAGGHDAWSADSAASGGTETTASILATERTLRKVAQRGVVKLFNAVRAAQIKAAEAERAAKKEGIIGIDKREAKVTEMSRKGFLDLIASGGGGLKKGGLEEA